MGSALSRGIQRCRRGASGDEDRGARLTETAYRAAEEAARYAYGRLVAYLARRSGDLNLAEDALADAFVSALEHWPLTGVPDRPEAWLMTAAGRVLIDRARREATQDRNAGKLLMAARDAEERAWRDGPFPDERLEMVFACAHPAIDRAVRTPLVLRAVLGIDAARIASAFLVSPVAMRQRLVRAKTKIRVAGIAFEVPDPAHLSDRLGVVLDTIYAAFSLSWEDGSPGGSDLNREAVWLARVVAQLMPREPEAQALLALLLFVEARREARRVEGAYIPLDVQDAARWSAPMLAEAEAILAGAVTANPGRFALEAAIQAQHVARRHGVATDWIAIARLYDALARFGAIGALVSRAAAHARAYGNAAGLAALEQLDRKRVEAYQPYWAVRAHLSGRPADYDRAIGLAQDEATRRFLTAKRAAAQGAGRNGLSH